MELAPGLLLGPTERGQVHSVVALGGENRGLTGKRGCEAAESASFWQSAALIRVQARRQTVGLAPGLLPGATGRGQVCSVVMLAMEQNRGLTEQSGLGQGESRVWRLSAHRRGMPVCGTRELRAGQSSGRLIGRPVVLAQSLRLRRAD